MTTTAEHSFYIGLIGSFYNQVNDTGSLELQVLINQIVYFSNICICMCTCNHYLIKTILIYDIVLIN